MKFVHVADVHLGAKPAAGSAYSSNRKNEIWHSFERIIKLCESKEIDLLLIAGDLFHRQPLLRELKEVNSLFSTLSKTKVVLMAGNHDYLKKGSFYREFQWNENVTMFLTDRMSRVELKELNTAIYGLSYTEKEPVKRDYENVRIQESMRYHILLAHGGDEKHYPFHKELVGNKGFDYVALGHIHKPQELIHNQMAYAGALEPIDVNDTGTHGYIEGALDVSGCRIHFIPFASREYIHLNIEVEEHMTGFQVKELIRQKIQENGVENIYKVILDGFLEPEVELDLENMDSFGNIVEIFDHTQPAYDFWALMSKNKDNLLGKYIESFGDAVPGTVEYEALCMGVRAFHETM